ncbi:MAG TPA: ROK family protein [Gammaproteobacteria bacterium]|nr:ROK family protein [Gammaproteobacteria bacterium]
MHHRQIRIGIDLGGTKIAAIALDGDGRELIRRRIATPRGDYAATVAAVHKLVRDMESELGVVASVGMGIPGAISPATGLVKNANSTWLIGQPLKQDLSAALQREVRIENDANCFIVSEATDGAARDAEVAFGVIVGTGTGGGIAIAGRAVTGVNAIGGEWGHNPLPWPGDDERPGPSCYCGKQACIETYLSGPGLERDYAAGAGVALSVPEIVARAEDGEPGAEATLVRYEQRMARALASVINVLDPQVIVLGGGLSNIARLYTTVPRLWQEYVFSDQVATQLRPPRHGDASGVRGAAWLWPAGDNNTTTC